MKVWFIYFKGCTKGTHPLPAGAREHDIALCQPTNPYLDIGEASLALVKSWNNGKSLWSGFYDLVEVEWDEDTGEIR